MDYNGRPKRTVIPDPLVAGKVEAKELCVEGKYCLPTDVGAVGNVLTVTGTGDTTDWLPSGQVQQGDYLFASSFPNFFGSLIETNIMNVTGFGSLTIPANSIIEGQSISIELYGEVETLAPAGSITILDLKLDTRNSFDGLRSYGIIVTPVQLPGSDVGTNFNNFSINVVLTFKNVAGGVADINLGGNVTLSYGDPPGGNPVGTKVVEFQLDGTYNYNTTLDETMEIRATGNTRIRTNHVVVKKGFIGTGSIEQLFDQNLNTFNSPSFAGLGVGPYTLPSVDGSVEQVLTTNGLGQVTWQDAQGVYDQDLNTTDDVTFDSVTLASAVPSQPVFVNMEADALTTTNQLHKFDGSTFWNHRHDPVNYTVLNNLNQPLMVLDQNDGDLQVGGTMTLGNGTYTLPAVDGTTNQVLTTDGLGTVTWNNAPSPFDQSLNTTDEAKFTGTTIESSSVGVNPYLVMNTASVADSCTQEYYYNGAKQWEQEWTPDDTIWKDSTGLQKMKLSRSAGNLSVTGLLTVSNNQYTFPATNGTAGQVLTTNGSQVLTWADPPSVETPSYGMIFFTNNTVPTSNFSPNTFESLTLPNPTPTLDINSQNFSQTGGNSLQLQYNGLGPVVAHIELCLFLEADGPSNNTYEVAIEKNGFPVAASIHQTQLDNSGSWPRNMSLQTLVSITTGDTLEPVFKNTTGGSQGVLVVCMQFSTHVIH